MMIEQKTFEHIDGWQLSTEEEYYNCVFIDCDFSEQTMVRTIFDQCTFRSCNFTMARLTGNFSDVLFIGCKMIGADFTKISAMSNGFVFEECCLDYANFLALKLWKTQFRSCKIMEANFDEADLTSAVFDDCNLERTSFVHTNLTKADFTTAYHYTLHPDHCRLKKTKFSEQGLRGLVEHLDILVE